MTFPQAAAHVLPFGKYKGSCLDDIARTDDGLRYLDWLGGELSVAAAGSIDTALAVVTYLSDPTIKAEVERALEHDDE